MFEDRTRSCGSKSSRTLTSPFFHPQGATHKKINPPQSLNNIRGDATHLRQNPTRGEAKKKKVWETKKESRKKEQMELVNKMNR